MSARTESAVQLLADVGTGVWIFCADRIVRPVWTRSLTDDPVMSADSPVHWIGDAPTSLHGNGAASFEFTTRVESAVTCRLCRSLLARGEHLTH